MTYIGDQNDAFWSCLACWEEKQKADKAAKLLIINHLRKTLIFALFAAASRVGCKYATPA